MAVMPSLFCLMSYVLVAFKKILSTAVHGWAQVAQAHYESPEQHYPT